MRGVIALTGATGFIGSAVTRKLVQDGWCVRALIRSPSSSARLAGTTVQWVQGTFEDLDSLFADGHLPFFTFLEGEVIYGRQQLREMREWEWSARLAESGWSSSM